MDHDHTATTPDETVATEATQTPGTDFDGLAGKPAAELTPEELRLMADTMPGDGPGD